MWSSIIILSHRLLYSATIYSLRLYGTCFASNDGLVTNLERGRRSVGYAVHLGEISYRFSYFPPVIGHNAVWLYCRFTLSFRDGEDLLGERGIEVSYETIRRWMARFGPAYAKRLRNLRPKAHPRWHLDGMFVSIGGRGVYLWRAVDQNGEVLDVLVQAKRDGRAALKLTRKRMNRHCFAPRTLVTDKLRADAAAVRELDLAARHHRAK